MRVLITGAAGFIGSHLADRFRQDGHTVFGVDNLLTGRADNYGDGLLIEDVADRDAFYGVANQAKPDLIVHCAASYSNPNYWHRDTDTNVTGTINATLAARHHDARLVYFQTALPPVSSYAISKIAGEQYIRLSGVPHTVFRLANIYGPRNVSGPIPTFYKRLTAGEPCTVVDTRRDMVYVADLVDTVMLAVHANVSGRFDVCSGIGRRIIELYDAVADEVGSTAEPTMVAAAADDVAEMKLDRGPTIDALGSWPATPFKDGVAAACAWYSEHGVTDTYTHLRLPETADAA